ncbi:DUF3488 and transglutaminase-like domain-containing protein [Acidiferrimicrobium sp. IK]|uniref:transglutaminase family protein n=1 Tax=Acidiferrimicrobium sp. IK TaxID=2871700 RepID=UPI0021CB4BA8|nr:transglutaminase domain-containing protein [Acidiferrimicrobium sp. IK]MCU4187105.1 DUF3488 and transglutaminase-like domain-containing protein [Acidiferrimicrobium sp. IK]
MTRPVLRRYVPAVASLLAVAAAGAAFERVFGWGGTAGPLVVATVLGGVGGGVARLALTAPAGGPGDGSGTSDQPASSGAALAGVAVVLATLLAPVATAALFASPGPGSPGRAVADGVGALTGGWSRILTTSVPVPPTASRLPLLAGVVALGAAAAVIVATRRRPGLGGLVPAGLVLLVALVLGVHGPGSLTTVVAPVAVAGVAYLLLVSRPPGDGATWVPPARALAAVATGVVVLTLSLAVGANFPFASSRQPVNLRTRLAPPVDLGSTPNPLNEVPARQGRGAGTVMFRADVDRTWLASPPDWRIASLDTYDGTGWSTDAKAIRAGNLLPAPAALDPSTLGPATTYRVHLAGLGGPWVPTAGVPTSVTPADLSYDPATTSLLATGPGAPGAFTVSARLPDPSRASLDTAAVPSGSAAAQLTSVPACFPAALRSLAEAVVARQGRPDQQAAAIEQSLAAGHGFALDPKAAPGSSCARLSAFAAAKSGSAEQFAAAFALMARSVGLPARLAVGFRPGTVSRGHPGGSFSGTTVVRGADATVWPEVEFAGLGWEAFSPFPASSAPGKTPGAGGVTTVPKLDQGLNQVRQTVASQAGGTVPRGDQGAALAGKASSGGGSFNPLLLVPVVLIAVLVMLTCARLLQRARLRARRRAAPTPAGQVRGAWAEVLDAFGPLAASHALAGGGRGGASATAGGGGAGRAGPLGTLTPSEVHALVLVACPAAAGPTLEVARAVDQAVFAEVASPATADAAWVAAGRAVAALRAALPAGRRARVLLAGSPGVGRSRRRVTPSALGAP